MSILETLKEIPVSDETAMLAAFTAAMGYFFGGFFGLMKIPLTRRERNAEAAKTEASAMEIMASQIVESNKQVIVSNQHTVVLTQTITTLIDKSDSEREMYRKRDAEREERHNAQIKALEKSLIESQEELKDTRERVNNLSEMVQKISIDNESKDKTIAELNRTIDSLQTRIRQLEADSKKAHEESATKDGEIIRLQGRVTELEAQVKAQQKPTAIEATVTIVDAHPTDGQPASPVVQPQGESSDPTPAQDSGVVS
jgi:thioester reductase-like protein